MGEEITEIQGVPQPPLLKELGIHPSEIKEIRQKHLNTGDWFKDKNRIFYTPEGEKKLRIYAAAWEETPQVVSYFSDAIILHPLPHPQWVAVKIENADGEWIKLNCAIPLRMRPLMGKGKKIRVEVVTDSTGTTARYEALEKRH